MNQFLFDSHGEEEMPPLFDKLYHTVNNGRTTGDYYTIENFWARRGRDAGETPFTNFDVGTVYFRHVGVQVSRICTILYSTSRAF
jgi:hypothetical protein